MKIDNIVENKEVVGFLISRKLLAQYKKCKKYLYEGEFKNVDFKLRKPKNKGIYYFRINKQYRALCVIQKNELRIFKIDDHS
jgi:plasmid maintenance system killer protein